jgi:integrase
MPLKLSAGSNRSPNYRIRGTLNGVRIDQSAGTSNYNEARQALKKLEFQIKSGAIKPKSSVTGFARAVQLYVAETKNERFIMPLLDYFGDKDITTISQQDIMRASHNICPTQTNATRNRQVFTPMIAILRMNGVYLPIKRPTKANGERRSFFFTQEDAAKLINAAYDRDYEFGLFLTFLLYTGGRLSEGLALTTDRIRLQEGRAVFAKTKNGKPRHVYLPPTLVAALASHPRGLERSGRVFKFVKCARLYRLLNDAEQASGVIIPEGVSFHAFRHSFGAWMRRYGGLDTSGLVATGAWHSRDAAQVYEHADANDAAKRADLLPIVGRLA